MGSLCCSCRKQSFSHEVLTPDLETRRQRQLQATEQRLAEQEGRGIKNIESVKRQEWLNQQREKRQEEADNMNVQPTLKWQVR